MKGYSINLLTGGDIMAKTNSSSKIIIIILVLVLLLLIGLSLNLGKVNLFQLDTETRYNILINIRLPRIILGVVIGVALSVSGAVLQSLLNNPLADSYTLGISSGAAFGACLAIYLNTVLHIFIPIKLTAVIFSILVLYIVLKIAGTSRRITTTNLVLSGIIVGSTCQAGISFLKSLANENAVAMIYWLMGSLASKNITEAGIITVIVICGVGIYYKFSKELNILTLGRREALLVGVDYDRINKLLMIVCTVMIAACVSLCGIIGFVGLVVPHLTRLLVGADNRKIIPLSSLMGAILLLTADTLSRSIFKYELPVGVITTIMGGPFFCYIFINRNKKVN